MYKCTEPTLSLPFSETSMWFLCFSIALEQWKRDGDRLVFVWMFFPGPHFQEGTFCASICPVKCGLIPQVLPAWYLHRSANEWAGKKECISGIFFPPEQLQWRSSFWRAEHQTCLILSVRMKFYLFKAVFKVTLITGLPTGCNDYSKH